MSSDNKKLGTFVRGRGPLQIVLLGVDSTADELLKRLSNETCDTRRPSKLMDLLRRRARLHIIPNYAQIDHLPYVKSIKPDSLLVFGSGQPESVVFSKGENTPRMFEKNRFDESLRRLHPYCAYM